VRQAIQIAILTQMDTQTVQTLINRIRQHVAMLEKDDLALAIRQAIAAQIYENLRTLEESLQ
jgi:hypothetical protein